MARRRWLLLLGGLVLLGLAAAGGATALESRDGFCASCHTEPETTYFRRSLDAPADLASYHAVLETRTRCMGCHALGTLHGRALVLGLAAYDLAKFVTGTYRQPAEMPFVMPNSACLQCHTQEVSKPGFENHFHNVLADPEAPDLPCVRCHPSHETGSSHDLFWVFRNEVLEACEFCHVEMERGPRGLAP